MPSIPLFGRFLLGLTPFLVSVAAGFSPALAQAPAPAVLVQPAEMRSLVRQNDFIGRVEAIEKVDLRARAVGFLSARKFTEGDRVKAGQVLLEIEREPFQAVVDQREAQLAGAKATYENARVQLDRGRELGRTNALSQAQVDQRIADEARGAANVKEAEAALEDAKIKLSYTEIRTPIDGRVGRASVSVGNLVGPESGVLATVVRDDEVRVLFSVSQRELLEARKLGQRLGTLRARLKLADGSMYPEPGKVDFLDVTVDARTDGQIVRATFPNPRNELSDGQTVRVSIEQETKEQSVAIPPAAIANDQSGQYVFVVGSDSKVEQRRIKTGAQRDGFVAVTEGLKAGDLVIVQGQQRVRPGMTVTAQRATN